MGELGPVDKEVLRERKLASAELVAKKAGSGLVVSGDERIAVMINEEDHLRLQAMRPGMDLEAVWRQLDEVDSELEQHVDYAFTGQLGYLTACPTNVGTALRASFMMHLPGLALTGEIDGVIKGLHRIGLEVRGVSGEGTEAAGNMFQVSNRSTLGQSESEIVGEITRLGMEVASHECNARERLMEQNRTLVLDQVCRAYGILSHARVMSSREAVDLLSALSLGIELKLVENLASARIAEVMLLTQPGHIQKMVERELSPEERDEIRAGMIKKELTGVTMVT